MNGNNFLKSAMEQITDNAGVSPVGQSTPVISPDGLLENDQGQALAEAQAQNNELQQELIESGDENSELVAERVSENIDNIEAAVEALQDLAGVVAGALRTGNINAHANAGFAMALESICSSVYIRDASAVAALEANAVMSYEGATEDPKAQEEAKGKGIFSTIREKIKQIWQGLVQMVRRVMANMASAKFLIQLQQEARDMDENLSRAESLAKTGFKGKITDPGLIKSMRVNHGSTASKVMIATSKVIQSSMHYTVDYERMAAGALRSVEQAPSETVREGVQSAVWKLSSELGSAISSGGANDTALQFKSEVLAGGIVLNLTREKREGALPKIEFGYEVIDSDLTAEIDTISIADINAFGSTIQSILKFSQNGGLTEVTQAVDRLKPTVPSSWMNAENIDDVQRYASAALGYIAKHTVQLHNTLMRVVYLRWCVVMNRWARATADAATARKPDEA